MTKSGLPQVLLLSRSPLLQGAALAAMLDLFRALVAAGAADPSTGLTAQALNESLAAPVVDANTGAQVHKQVCCSFHLFLVIDNVFLDLIPNLAQSKKSLTKDGGSRERKKYVIRKTFLGTIFRSLSLQGRAATAKCVAAVLSSSPGEAKQAVSGWCALIQSKKCMPHQQTFFLLAIGEIGRIQ